MSVQVVLSVLISSSSTHAASDPELVLMSLVYSHFSSCGPGASVVLFYAHAAPAAGPVIGFGELLISLGSPRIGRFSMASAGGVTAFNVPVPNDVAIVGQTAYCQAAIAGGGNVELCNAIDATAGN